MTNPGIIICRATLLALVLATPSLSWSADTPVKSRDGACQAFVPAGWTLGQIGGSASSPDGQLSLTISSPKMIDSFDQLKQTAQSVYKGSKVTRSTASDFMMEGNSITGKPNVYRAIAIGPTKFCITEVMYESGGPEAPRTIVQTLKAAK